MLIIRIVLVLVQVALALGAESTPEKIKLDALCKDEKVNLHSLQQFHSLVEQHELFGRSICPGKVISALMDFATVVDEDKDNVCSMYKVNMYEEFYNIYLNSIDDGDHCDFKPLPKSLRKFVLAYGMQLANTCRWNIYKELNGRVRGMLKDQDFQQVSDFISRKSPLYWIVGSTRYPDDFFLPIDFLGPELADEESEWVMSEGMERSNLQALKRVCERRFQPIYEPLMMPLARLARLGFNYRDSQLKSELKAEKVKEDLARWPRVVFLCELVKNLKVMSEEENVMREQELQIERHNMVVLSEEELNKISSLDTQLDYSDEDVGGVQYVDSFEASVKDLIYEPKNKRLTKQISDFGTDFCTRKVTRDRLKSNFRSVMGDHLKHLRIHSAMAKVIKNQWRQLDYWFNFKDEQNEFVTDFEKRLAPTAYYDRGPSRFVRFMYGGAEVIIKTTAMTIIFIAMSCIFAFCL